MIQDYIDMDTQQNVRYISESSNNSTSGYSTISTQHGNQSPAFSMLSSSPSKSPNTAALPVEFSNLNMPHTGLMNNPHYELTNKFSVQQQQQQHHQNDHTGGFMFQTNVDYTNISEAPTTSCDVQQPRIPYIAELRILEQPMEKFRFRYKSEMHGTHGSLNGVNSKRTPKTFPAVELCNFNGPAIIRCSLFQPNKDSPHSHQLVIRKDDKDVCDPHDLSVSPERGFVVQFQNMGIIHTAKKFIYDELLKKKINRLLFTLGREELSTKQMQELHKEVEREAKEMNLNQVRLCFEAFQVVGKVCTPVAAAVFTHAINNRKSAQTGELRICKLSLAAGSVAGGDDLILLVEKVSKKNIKVRFYELNEDEEVVWEAFAKFRESDVHHQYAIVCETPAYKNVNVEKPVEVCIELIRPSDDERSAALTFRYKPRQNAGNLKRRRTTSNYSNNYSYSSDELPKTLNEHTAHLMPAPLNATPLMQQIQQHQQQQQQQTQQQQYEYGKAPTISEEFNKEHELQKLIYTDEFVNELITTNSEELSKICPQSISDLYFSLDPTSSNNFVQQQQQKQHQQQQQNQTNEQGRLETDGVAARPRVKKSLNKSTNHFDTNIMHLKKIFHVYDALCALPQVNEHKIDNARKLVENLYIEYAERNVMGETILHEIIANNNIKLFIKLLLVLRVLKLESLLNNQLNVHEESALHCAIWHNRPTYIRPLLTLGCNPNLQEQTGNTALHIAVMQAEMGCIDKLLQMKSLCKLDLRNDEGFTPLHLAIRLKHVDIVQRLLAYDAQAVLVPTTKEGNNALHLAALQQNRAIIECLLKLGNYELLMARNAAGQRALNLLKSFVHTCGGNLLAVLKNVLGNHLIDEVAEEESLEEELENEDVENIPETRNLATLLQDTNKFQKLSKLLNANNSWQLVAKKCQLKHLICLWTQSQDMLHYISSKTDTVDYEKFTNALKEINNDAMEVLLIN